MNDKNNNNVIYALTNASRDKKKHNDRHNESILKNYYDFYWIDSVLAFRMFMKWCIY